MTTANYNRYQADIRKAEREEAADAADRARKARRQVQRIAEWQSLVEITGNLFFAQFEAAHVSNMSDLECNEFMNAMKQIDNIVSECVIEAIVEKAITA